MPVIVALFMNIIVGSSSLLLGQRFLKSNDRVDSLIIFLILFFSQIVYSTLGLGLVGLLSTANLILFNLAVFLAVVLFALRRGVNKPLFKATPNIDISPIRNYAEGDKTALFMLSLILGFALVKIYINLVNPPFGWDDLNYHFTFPVEWLKHGNLSNPITVFDDPSPSYYPINGSLIFAWLMAPLSNVFLADLGQVPFFMLLFLTVFSLSRKIGLNSSLSFYSAAMLIIIPNLFKQLKIAYVDVMVAALFLSGFVSLFLLNRDFSLKNVLLYSLSTGLLIGTKTLALFYGFVLCVPFVYLGLKHLRRFHLCIVSLIVIISIGGFSYIRNLLDTGNPLYPLNFNLFDLKLLRGVISPGLYRIHFNVSDYRLAKLLFHEGLGVQTLIFILPGVVLGLPMLLLKRQVKPLGFIPVFFFLSPFFVYAIYRYLIPLPNSRYLYPFLGLGTVTGFYVAGMLRLPRRILKPLVIICALASIPELARHSELVASLLLSLLLFALFLYYLRSHRGVASIVFSWRPFIAIFILVAVGLVFLEKDYVANEFSRYVSMERYSGFWPDATRAWEWLNNNTNASNIAYAGRPVPFPLYGARFKNNVYYVSLNRTEPARLHYFPHSQYAWREDFLSLHKNLEAPGNYRSGADYGAWLANLKARKIDLLFIYSLHQTKDIAFPAEDGWARDNPVVFKPVFANQTVRIYKVLL